jgi:hypothetical protein
MSFDILEPDFTPLANEFLALIGQRDQVSLQSLADHALIETIYKSTHAKTAADRLVAQGKIELAATGKSHQERMYRLAPPSLF